MNTPRSDRWPVNHAEMTNRPTPGWKPTSPPTSPLMDDVSAARYLLLAEGKDDDAAVKAINRLVDSRKVRPCVIGGLRRYWKTELDKCIADLTDGWNA